MSDKHSVLIAKYDIKNCTAEIGQRDYWYEKYEEASYDYSKKSGRTLLSHFYAIFPFLVNVIAVTFKASNLGKRRGWWFNLKLIR